MTASPSRARARTVRSRARRFILPATLAVVATLGSGATKAAETRTAAPDELLVELLGPEGAPLTAVDPGDLEVVEAGRSRPVTAVEPVGEWRVVLYFDQLLAEPSRFNAALFELAERARELVALGPVEVVMAGEQVRSTLPPTREAEALDQALSWMRVRETASGAQAAVRERFVEELNESGVLTAEGPGDPEAIARLSAAAREAMADEVALTAAHRHQLVSWMASQSGDAEPRLLILASGGYDGDPEAFYRALLDGTSLAGAVSGAAMPSADPTPEAMARAASIYGWVALPFRPPPGPDPMLAESEEARRAREEDERVQTEMSDGRMVDRVLVDVGDLTDLFGRKKGKARPEPVAVLVAPTAPLETLARETGGELVGDRLALDGALERLARRFRVRFAAAPLEPTAEVPLEVLWRGGSDAAPTIRSRRWTSAATPEAAAAARARAYLEDDVDEGELFASASLAADPEATVGRLAVRFDTPLPPTAERPLRLTVVVGDDPGGRPRVEHHLVPGDGNLEPETDAEGWRSVSLDVDLPGGPETPVAVVVEDAVTGRWGAAFAAASVATEAVSDLYLPAPKAIHLMAPRDQMVMGRRTFDTVVSEHRVARVDFLLDGRKVAASFQPPFSAAIDLGKLPEVRQLEAVAYDASGREIDRDRLTLNEGSGSFRVRIVDPRNADQRAGRAPVTGPVTVRADVRTPRGARVERVDFYWRQDLVGTRFAPPFVHRVAVPGDGTPGFVRVVARLEDGAVSEDVLVVNSPGSSERVNVDLVELYVVVTDRKGRPVEGLQKEDFRVLEEGDPQSLATFGDAGEQPITVGLAIDSSASMFVKLPEVQRAATTYLQGLSSQKDRAFVVGFGEEPRLARDTTADLSQAIRGLYRLEPDGHTAIWRAVVYSLVQLQGVSGKKALIVYSDGADEDPDFSYRTCLAFARRVGVPVYFIVANDEIARTEGKSLNIRGFLGRLQNLVREVGGRVYLTRIDEDLGAIYREIDEELRSQYVLGYYVEEMGGDRWRRVEVEVDRPGAIARTIAGYYR